MRSEECRHVIEGRLVIQFSDCAQHLEFVIECKAISRLRLDGCCAASQEPTCISPACCDQFVDRGGTRCFHGRLDPSAASSYILVGGAARSLFKLICSYSGKNRMRM